MGTWPFGIDIEFRSENHPQLKLQISAVDPGSSQQHTVKKYLINKKPKTILKSQSAPPVFQYQIKFSAAKYGFINQQFNYLSLTLENEDHTGRDLQKPLHKDLFTLLLNIYKDDKASLLFSILFSTKKDTVFFFPLIRN